MSRKETNSGAGTLTTFTVCADGELSSMAMSAPANVPGVEFAGDFQDYITADRRPHFPAAVKQAQSCVAFIDFDRHPEQAIETAEALRNLTTPRIVPVGVSSTLNTELLLRAMRAGCGEFLEKPLAAARFHHALQSIQSRLISSLPAQESRGQVIALFGAKGGVGVTTLAVHLGAALARNSGQKTLLVDHHAQLGHVCLYLGIKESHYHFDELIRNIDRLDSDLLKGFVIRHSSGLEVLAAPDRYASHSGSSREEIMQVVDFLRQQYQMVVIDSSLQPEHAALPLIECADQVLFVTTPDLAALRDLARHVEKFNLAEIASNKVQLILNRANSSNAIGSEQIQKAVRLPVTLTLPSAFEEISRAINSGELVSTDRRSDFAAQITKWASRVALTETKGAPAKKKFSLWK